LKEGKKGGRERPEEETLEEWNKKKRNTWDKGLQKETHCIKRKNQDKRGGLRRKMKGT